MTKLTPCITLYSPWAYWVAFGWKTIETRTHDKFKSLVGKRIGIHVAQKYDKYAIDAAKTYITQEQIIVTEKFLKVNGLIICTAFVENFRELEDEDSKNAMIECAYTKRYGLFLKDVNLIEAIPFSGKQGIWYAELPNS